jgi:hypothetical protein
MVSKGIEAKKRRKEKLTEDDERMDGMLTEKFIQQGECVAQTLPKLPKMRGSSFMANELGRELIKHAAITLLTRAG